MSRSSVVERQISLEPNLMSVLVQPAGDNPIRIHRFDGTVGDPHAVVSIEDAGQHLLGQASLHLEAIQRDSTAFQRPRVVVGQQQRLPWAMEQQPIVGVGKRPQVLHASTKTPTRRAVDQRIGVDVHKDDPQQQQKW